MVEILTMNGSEYKGTITPSEARSTIFGEALGLDQVNLASITIGFNRGRIVTFKLKQQIDIDVLYPRENFEFERKLGQDIVVMACRIRGVRNPATRPTTRPTTTNPTPKAAPYMDDGTRDIKITGCEYKLSETEILDWLACFGDVISEITEERFGSEVS